MIGDVIELSIVVTDLEPAIKRFESLFALNVYDRRESTEYGFKNAVLPLGRGHIDLMQPTDPTSAVGRFLKARGEGIYMVGFEAKDIPASVKILQEKGCRVTQSRDGSVAWVHPKDAYGVFIELRKPECYK